MSEQLEQQNNVEATPSLHINFVQEPGDAEFMDYLTTPAGDAIMVKAVRREDGGLDVTVLSDAEPQATALALVNLGTQIQVGLDEQIPVDFSGPVEGQGVEV